MNIYAVIILAALLLDLVLNFLADVLNLRALHPDLPEAFRGVYDAEAYRTSQEYTRVRTQFGWVTATVMLGVTVIFWFSGGFQALDVLVRGWGIGPIWNGLAYIGLLMLGRALLSLPFSIYS